MKLINRESDDAERKQEVVALEQHLMSRYRFFEWFASAWERSGGRGKKDVDWPRKFRAIMGRLFGFSISAHTSKERLLVCGCHRIESCAWPWNYRYEIVPVMWDLWPMNYPYFEKFIVRNVVKVCFCTARQSVNWLRDRFPELKVFWLPEAIDVATFPCGSRLVERPIDILCYGRSVSFVDQAIANLVKKRGFRYQHECGESVEELASTVRLSKISICYPRSDTDPQTAAGVETLTQRYWEAMCSGTLIVGRAPKELIDVCGYNPVLELGKDIESEIERVLDSVADYQWLVDKNRMCAERCGDWMSRMDIVREGCGISEKTHE